MAAHLSKPDAKCKAARQAEPVLKLIGASASIAPLTKPPKSSNSPVTACPLWPYRMGKNPFAKPRGGFSRPLKNSPLITANSNGIGPIRGGRGVSP